MQFKLKTENMKNQMLYIVIIVFIMMSGCEKDNQGDDGNSPSYCSKSKFQTSITDLMIPTSINEDSENSIIVLGNNGGKISIIKLDTLGREIWNKTYSNIPGIASEIIALDDNSIIVSSYKKNEVEPITNLPVLDNVWIQDSYFTVFNCEPHFILGSVDGYNVISETYLTRLDKNGNVIWTNNFEGCLGKGNSILKNSQGNINLITLKLKGRVPILVYDNNGVFQDTVRYPEDDNTLCFYNINKDGSTLWKKEFDNIYNFGYDEVSTKIDIQETNNYQIIKTEKNILYLSKSGDSIKNHKIHDEYCNNTNKSMCGYGSKILVSGLYITIDTVITNYHYNNYIQQLSEQGNVIWEIENEDILLDYYSDRILTKSKDSAKMNVYDIDGSILWSLTSPSSKISILNCSKGLTSVENINGQLIITRTNDMGEF